MRKLFILFCLFPLVTKSQSVIGKWKIVAINNGVYFSYKDSASTINQFLNSLKGKKDSSESAAVFMRTIALYKDYSISFYKDGTYKEIQGGITKGATSEVMEFNGIYDVNLAHNYLELSMKNKKRHVVYSLDFIPKGIKLYYTAMGLISRNENSDIILTLEKSQ